jgi:hypothetical protein
MACQKKEDILMKLRENSITIKIKPIIGRMFFPLSFIGLILLDAKNYITIYMYHICYAAAIDLIEL